MIETKGEKCEEKNCWRYFLAEFSVTRIVGVGHIYTFYKWKNTRIWQAIEQVLHDFGQNYKGMNFGR